MKNAIEWLIQNAPRGHYSSDNGSELENDQFMIKNQSYLVIHPDKLREWVASSLHRGLLDYEPKTKNRILNPPTDWVLRCSCGEFEEWFKSEDLNKRRPFDPPDIPKEKFNAHVKEEINSMTVEFKEDWSDLV